GGARAPRGDERRAHARARRGRRRALRARGGGAREGARARRGEPRPTRRLQPPEPPSGRPGRARAARAAARGRARARRRGPGRGRPAARPSARARVGERPRARRDCDGRARRRARGRPADRERRDLRACRRYRHRGRRGGAALPRRLPRDRRLLARADALRRRLRADRGARDGDQRRRDAAAVTVVVKLGSSLVAASGGRVRRSLLRARGAEIGRIVEGGEPVCVVSSGAIALGLPRLGLERRPRSVARLQAASALGEARLQAAWEEALAPVPVAQVLLTAADVGERTTYVNARNALTALFRLGAVPVVNENDAT